MNQAIGGNKRKLAALVLAAVSSGAYAEELLDPAVRIQQLEKIMQQMQVQREEQNKQLQVMAEELKAMQQQMANGKEEKVKEKGKSTGSPVYAAFKDGLVFDDGSGNWKLQLNGRVQADYRDYNPSEWQSDTFSIRRARFGGTFTFLKDYSIRVEGEYANVPSASATSYNNNSSATTGLTYAYLNYGHWKEANIRLGQFKPFFGLERAESTNFTDFTELSLATNNGTIFNSTYDRGVMVFGDPVPGVNYNIYAVNGTGMNANDFNNQKDTGARINANFAQLADIKNAVLHVGTSASTGNLGFDTSCSSGPNPCSNTGLISQQTEGMGVKFFSTTNGMHGNSDRTRLGFETALTYGPVKLQSEYIHANFDGKWNSGSSTYHYDNDINNWYVDLNWMLTGESYADNYKSGVFGRMSPKNNLTFGKDGWGAIEFGLRYSKFDASDFANKPSGSSVSMLANTTGTKGCGSSNPAAVSTNTCYTSQADAWTTGVKWILNPNARIMLNYIHTSFDDPVTFNGRTQDFENDLVLRTQFDF
ncbi:MAG TPA: porin [Methylophilaceae bacterium]|nr:porin [Methylophilaceae bacterium]